MRCTVHAFLVWHKIGPLRKVFAFIIVVFSYIILFLNYYWFMLIIKGTKRLLEEKGILSKPKDPNYYKDLDEYDLTN